MVSSATQGPTIEDPEREILFPTLEPKYVTAPRQTTAIKARRSEYSTRDAP